MKPTVLVEQVVNPLPHLVALRIPSLGVHPPARLPVVPPIFSPVPHPMRLFHPDLQALPVNLLPVALLVVPSLPPLHIGPPEVALPLAHRLLSLPQEPPQVPMPTAPSLPRLVGPLPPTLPPHPRKPLVVDALTSDSLLIAAGSGAGTRQTPRMALQWEARRLK